MCERMRERIRLGECVRDEAQTRTLFRRFCLISVKD